MKNTVKGKWADYVQNVMPASACQKQIEEGKLCFYAGFLAAYSTMTKDITAMSDADAIKAMDALGIELATFAVEFRAKGKVP